MTATTVSTFFYGSYMNRAVLQEADVAFDRCEPARLDGYNIRIAPRANLVASQEHCVYGALAQATHAELARLYAPREGRPRRDVPPASGPGTAAAGRLAARALLHRPLHGPARA